MSQCCRLIYFWETHFFSKAIQVRPKSKLTSIVHMGKKKRWKKEQKHSGFRGKSVFISAESKNLWAHDEVCTFCTFLRESTQLHILFGLVTMEGYYRVLLMSKKHKLNWTWQHCALTCWKQPSEPGERVLIRGRHGERLHRDLRCLNNAEFIVRAQSSPRT